MRPGPTRSNRNSGRCGPLPWAALTTPTTPSWPGGCRPTCAGATPTPATPTSWPPSGANAPASAANVSNAGADPNPSHKRHDQPGERSPGGSSQRWRRPSSATPPLPVAGQDRSLPPRAAFAPAGRPPAASARVARRVIGNKVREVRADISHAQYVAEELRQFVGPRSQRLGGGSQCFVGLRPGEDWVLVPDRPGV